MSLFTRDGKLVLLRFLQLAAKFNPMTVFDLGVDEFHPLIKNCDVCHINIGEGFATEYHLIFTYFWHRTSHIGFSWNGVKT